MKYQRFRTYKTKDFFPKNMGEESHHIDAELCMAVRAGNRIFLRGQTGFDFEGNFHGVGDVAKQTDVACRNIRQLIEEAGGTMEDVCKITVYLTDRSYRNEAYGVIAEHFKGVYPCSTGLIVNGLALPELLVEIDVEVVLSE
jgi:enamine deaminase RidA (YjgF/YER057c/UK114 family)